MWCGAIRRVSFGKSSGVKALTSVSLCAWDDPCPRPEVHVQPRGPPGYIRLSASSHVIFMLLELNMQQSGLSQRSMTSRRLYMWVLRD